MDCACGKSYLSFVLNYWLWQEKRIKAQFIEVGGQAVLGRQDSLTTPWLTERHGYDPTLRDLYAKGCTGSDFKNLEKSEAKRS